MGKLKISSTLDPSGKKKKNLGGFEGGAPHMYPWGTRATPDFHKRRGSSYLQEQLIQRKKEDASRWEKKKVSIDSATKSINLKRIE